MAWLSRSRCGTGAAVKQRSVMLCKLEILSRLNSQSIGEKVLRLAQRQKSAQHIPCPQSPCNLCPVTGSRETRPMVASAAEHVFDGVAGMFELQPLDISAVGMLWTPCSGVFCQSAIATSLHAVCLR